MPKHNRPEQSERNPDVCNILVITYREIIYDRFT